MSEKVITKFKLGEIFNFPVSYEDTEEVDGKEVSKIVNEIVTGTFIKVGESYYLINIDNENPDNPELDFFGELPDLTCKGKQREGSDPFSYEEALQYLISRKASTVGKMLVPLPEPPKSFSSVLSSGKYKKSTIGTAWTEATSSITPGTVVSINEWD